MGAVQIPPIHFLILCYALGARARRAARHTWLSGCGGIIKPWTGMTLSDQVKFTHTQWSWQERAVKFLAERGVRKWGEALWIMMVTVTSNYYAPNCTPGCIWSSLPGTVRLMSSMYR